MTRVIIATREIRSIRRNSIMECCIKKNNMSDDDFLQDETIGSPLRLLTRPKKYYICRLPPCIQTDNKKVEQCNELQFFSSHLFITKKKKKWNLEVGTRQIVKKYKKTS